MIDHLTMSGQERAELGCVPSFENSEGKTLVLHRAGPLVQGCADMCDLAESLDPSFRVTAYSSPATIYTDITGGRMRSAASRNPEFDQETHLPEKGALSRAGRLHMLHPRLALIGGDERVQNLKRAAAARRQERRLR